jgi:hypothetical protein
MFTLQCKASAIRRIDRSTFVLCSRLDANLYACHSLDNEREGKLLDLRTGYFTILMCAKETKVSFTADPAPGGLAYGSPTWPTPASGSLPRALVANTGDYLRLSASQDMTARNNDPHLALEGCWNRPQQERRNGFRPCDPCFPDDRARPVRLAPTTGGRIARAVAGRRATIRRAAGRGAGSDDSGPTGPRASGRRGASAAGTAVARGPSGPPPVEDDRCGHQVDVPPPCRSS